jgi:argininosuccinate lyase
VALSTVLHGLPLGYHRDLQEDKEAAFDAADTLGTSAAALSGCVATLTFDAEAMRRSAEAEGLYATDIAEALVLGGVPFREAHRRISELVGALEAERRSFRDLSADEWAALGVPNGAELLDAERSVRARAMTGGPSPDSVRAQIAALERALTTEA